MKSDERRGLWLAFMAVLCFSTSPVFLIWADPLSPYEKTAWRMGIAALILFVFMLVRHRLPRYSRQDGGKFLLFGLVTAVHFLSYIASLSFTSIAHSLTVIYTAPVFVTLFSAWFLKEPVARRKYIGIAVVIVGTAILAGFEPALTPRMLIGDGLALVSAIAFGFYSVMGRSQRVAYPLLTYAFAIYGVAAVWLIPAALVTFTPAGYGPRQILSLIGVGVIPLAVGHTLYNAALRRTHATYANLIATQEVTGGVVLGALLLGQMPTLNSVVGAVVTLLGIVLVLV
jgi:drug/metabolite transporter (DMT)-like permease